MINFGDNPAQLEWLSVNSKPELKSKFVWKLFSALQFSKKSIGNVRLARMQNL